MTLRPRSFLWSVLVLLLAVQLASSGDDSATSSSKHRALDGSLAIESLGEEEACDGAREAPPRAGAPSTAGNHPVATTRSISPRVALYLLKHSLLI